MLTLARLGMVLSCLMVSYVGLRTLLVWARTRRLPELLIGINVFGVAAGGALLVGLVAIQPSPGTDVLRVIAYWLGNLFIIAHVVGLYLGNWLIYRPRDRWPLPINVAAFAMAVVWAASGDYGTGEPTPARSILLSGVRGLGMAWAAWECFRWSRMLERRLSLGLTEPMMPHRLRLWGVGATSQMLGAGVGLAGALHWGSAYAQPPVLFTLSLLALVGGGAIALAFFPPPAYQRLILRQGDSAAREGV